MTTNNHGIETLMGATLTWHGASNLQGEYLLESYTKATKGKAEVWLHDKASGHIITMDLSRRTSAFSFSGVHDPFIASSGCDG